ncbi:MAG TPA: DUF6580 family putative transport protein [Candidatus Saccharimonadales bacterium]
MEVRVGRRQLLVGVALVAFGVVMRLVPHPANFAPVGAIALFGGAIFGKRYGWWLPVVVMMISDLYLGFYSSMPFTWAAYALIGLIGVSMKRWHGWWRVPVGSAASSLTFFAVSNFGVWINGGLYAHTWSGLVQCFTLALPFFRPTVVSDLVFSGIFFGVYALAARLAAVPLSLEQ